jgi:putative peptidoglycan lipid II flippase
VLGFVREMVVARVLGASSAADVFTLAFLIPNLFRRLFGEALSPRASSPCSASA